MADHSSEISGPLSCQGPGTVSKAVVYGADGELPCPGSPSGGRPCQFYKVYPGTGKGGGGDVYAADGMTSLVDASDGDYFSGRGGAG